MAARYAELVADRERLLMGVENDRRWTNTSAWGRTYEPAIRALCESPAAYAIPESLRHDDFGAGNAPVSGDRYIFYDWAERAITRTFCSMFIALRWARYVAEYSQP